MPPIGNREIAAVTPRLLDLAGLDTVYRDLYLLRAEELLAPVLDERGFRALQRQNRANATLPEGIRQAMAAGDWQRVSELSGRLRSTQETLEERRELFDLGRQLYEAPPVVLDPFSPGLQPLAGVSARELPELRERALRQLTDLEKEDPGRRDFYARRGSALGSLAMERVPSGVSAPAPTSSARLQEEAADALARGNLGRLEEIARRLAQGAQASAVSEKAGSAGPGEGEREGPAELLLSFPEEVLDAAARMGLVPLRAESWRERFIHLRRYAWHPTFADQPEGGAEARRLQSVPFPEGTPDALKERMSLFASHPCINSGGARLVPWLAAEDALVEDFPDPARGPEAPSGPFLALLGLERRHALSRHFLEKILRSRGTGVLRELGLDPEEFRLVCIPADLHLRFGLERGWGQQQIWTHFDGYMVMGDGHLRPLAGGDVRFGGIYDLVSIGMDYESEGVIARFAVVQRRRMQAW